MPPSPRPLRNARQRRSTPAGRDHQALCGLVNRVLRDIAVEVSSRGICALEAARLAHLPSADRELVSAACGCAECSRKRLH